MHTEKRAYEDIERRKPSASQGKRLPQKTTLPEFGFLAFETMRNKFPLKSCSMCCFVKAAPAH